MKRLFAASLLLLLLLPASARAQAPSTMSYQGVLTDASGNLVADGNYSLTFRIYDVASGGAALWTEAQGVTTEKGGFSVILGQVTPLALPFDKPYWLGIQVFSEAELAPRVRLASSPYALSLRLPFAQTLSSAAPLFSLRNTGSGAAVVADPSLDVGGASTGLLELHRAGELSQQIQLTSSVKGGYQYWYDELGNVTAQIAPDGNDSGGFGVIYRGVGLFGVSMDGNYLSSGEPSLSVSGSTRNATFNMSFTGNSSVALPVDAISAAETFDEPGVASETDDVTLTLDGTVQALLSRTITVPASGWVVAIATAQVNLTHVSGTASGAQFGVSMSATTFPANQDMPWNLPAPAPSGSYFQTLTVQGTFPVNAGANTFFFLGDEGTGSYSVNDRQLTLLYFPTAYGTVTPPGPQSSAGKVRGALTDFEIAAEQREAQAFQQARVDRELAAMREQVEALQKQLAELAARQGDSKQDQP
jgi:hypothetical protein